MDDPFAIFFHEYLRSATELTAKIGLHLDRLTIDPASAEDLVGLRRAWHSLRGNSAFVPDCPITAMAEAAEEAVDAVLEGPSPIAPLIGPLRTVLGEAQAWVTAAESQTPGKRDARASRELVAALAALAAARRAASAPHRYFYGGEDVSELLELLEREETAAGMEAGSARSPAPPELGPALDRVARLAKIEGGTAPAELEAARTGEIRDVIRFLAARVTCVTGR